MILQFLRFFRIVRDLEAQLTHAWADAAKTANALADVRAENRTLEAQLDAAQQKQAYWQAKYDSAAESATYWREACGKAESRAQDATEELTEALKNAGDTMALRAVGKRLFSKAPVEAPPNAQPSPVGISRGSSKPFARDQAKQATAKSLHAFFQQQAEAVGVAPAEVKPN